MSKLSKMTRRDFLNGSLLTLGSTVLSPIALGETIENLITNDYYPPQLTGMRGSHPGSFEVAHQLAWSGKSDWGEVTDTDEDIYDLVVVGAGISGLAAAWFFREQHGKDARILVLDNHDDFGGHAKRNEFNDNGRLRICNGGSQAMEDPSNYSDICKDLLKSLGVDLNRFEKAYDDKFQDRQGFEEKIFFDKGNYGKDQLVSFSFDDYQDADLAVQQMPLSSEAKEQFLRILNAEKDTLDKINVFKRMDYAKKTSYFQYLKDHLNIQSLEVFELLRYIPGGNLGAGADTLSLIEALYFGLPGIKARSVLPLIGNYVMDASSGEADPYIYHFPDGNASIARLLVRDLIPGVAPGQSMDDIVLSRFNYNKLDQQSSNVRLRLNSTVINASHVEQADKTQQVLITYINNKRAYRVQAKNCVMACYNMIIPHIVPELPTQQKQALEKLVKSPLVYSNVLLKDWSALKKLGIGYAYCPGRLHTDVSVDFPITMGGHSAFHSTTESTYLFMEYIPVSSTYGLSPRQQYREGRHKLLTMSFSDFETEIKHHLGAMLGPGGFDPEKDIKAITINRWSHGYAYGVGNEYSLFDNETDEEKLPHIIGRQRFGRITIANSDAGASAYMNEAIDQAWRAVLELSN